MKLILSERDMRMLEVAALGGEPTHRADVQKLINNLRATQDALGDALMHVRLALTADALVADGFSDDDTEVRRILAALCQRLVAAGAVDPMEAEIEPAPALAPPADKPENAPDFVPQESKPESEREKSSGGDTA